MPAFPALGLDAGPHAEDGRGSEAGEEGLACTTATEPRAGLVNAGLRVPRPGGPGTVPGASGMGTGLQSTFPTPLQTGPGWREPGGRAYAGHSGQQLSAAQGAGTDSRHLCPGSWRHASCQRPPGGTVAVCGPRHLCGHWVPVTATAGSARTRLQPGLAASSFAWQGVWPEGWASPCPLQAEGGLSGVGHWESRWVGVQAGGWEGAGGGGPGARRRGWVCKGGNGHGQQLPPLRGPVHQLMQEWAPWGASVRAPWGLSREESGQRVRGRPGGGSERRAGVHWGPGRAWWAE